MSHLVTIPGSEPAEIRRPQGNAEQADALATRLYEASSRFSEFVDEAWQLRRMDGCRGEAFDSYRHATRRAASDTDPLATTSRRVARAVTAYADNLREHRATYRDLRERKQSLDAERAALMADTQVTTTPGQAADPHPAFLAEVQRRARDLKAGYAALTHDEAQLFSRVTQNEELLKQSFEAADTRAEAESSRGGRTDLARDAMAKPGAPGDSSPEAVARWWKSLTHAEREAVVAGYPAIIGGAEGVPWSGRDQANRIKLDDTLARLGAKEADGTILTWESTALANARDAALELRGNPEAKLVDCRPGAGDVRIVAC